VIAFCGAAGAGKSTAGAYLDKYGYTPISLAEPLKKMVKTAFPHFTDEDLYGPSEGRNRQYRQYPITSCPWCGGALRTELYDGPNNARHCIVHPAHKYIPDFVSPRLALQTLGTEWGRRLYSGVWVNALVHGISTPPADTCRYVITDVRFINEVEGLAACGIPCVLLERNNPRYATHANRVSLHDSERVDTIPPGMFRAVIDNRNLSLPQLYEKLEELIG
jgi:hypothetical protein